MLIYVLIGLSLVLVGIVGLQFSYLFYVDRILKERKKYLRSLEQRHARLTERLESAERRIAEQDDLLETVFPKLEHEEEVWADVIEDR